MLSATNPRSANRVLTAAAPHASVEPGVFDWPLAEQAEEFLRQRIAGFLLANRCAATLAQRMSQETATDFFEWVDHLVLAPDQEQELSKVGFVHDKQAEAPAGEAVYEHPRATLPRVLVRTGSGRQPFVVALRPEFVADFIARNNLAAEPLGEPMSRYRRVVVAEENGTRLEAVERRAYRGFIPAPLGNGELEAVVQARELWRTRQRLFDEDSDGFKAAKRILACVVELVGRDLACQSFFEAERAYWESRNQAARLQKHRQDQLGLGWGNHDHHTFRCSREHFAELIDFLVGLGFRMGRGRRS